jgi:hypothetical protein
VRQFEEPRVDLGSATVNWPLLARSHRIIDIHLDGPFRVRPGRGSAKSIPELVVVGTQTFPRTQFSISGRIPVFNILSQPAGLNQLIGVDMRPLVNQNPAPPNVLGRSAVQACR